MQQWHAVMRATEVAVPCGGDGGGEGGAREVGRAVAMEEVV